ncbi:MAG TPA: hypothetical protein V6C97_00835 [Oculatellaceae cyanobacterium]
MKEAIAEVKQAEQELEDAVKSKAPAEVIALKRESVADRRTFRDTIQARIPTGLLSAVLSLGLREVCFFQLLQGSQGTPVPVSF